MKQYFKIGAARCKTLHIPEGTVFPVIRVENNMVGGKGFDTYVYLDTGDGYYNGVYIGQQEMFAARGEFVTEAEYLASLPKPTIKEKADKLTNAGYYQPYAGIWKKQSKKYANRWVVVDIGGEMDVAYMEDQYGRVMTDMEPIDWSKFK